MLRTFPVANLIPRISLLPVQRRREDEGPHWVALVVLFF